AWWFHGANNSAEMGQSGAADRRSRVLQLAPYSSKSQKLPKRVQVVQSAGRFHDIMLLVL
ncbi:MAG: hypothetical protein Q9M31_02925, partial [Mariprofundus sp.]|nr:hypothetical protein [Mariprofundus sp.]